MHIHHHAENTDDIAIDYYAYESGMKNSSPAFKIVAGICGMLLCLVLNQIWVSIFTMVSMMMVTVHYGKIPFRKYMGVFSIPGAFALISGLAIAVEVSFQGGFHLLVTMEHVYRAWNVVLRSFACVSCVFFFSLTTPVSELILSLEKLHCPKLLTELMHMIYRFIFILFQVQKQMSVAAASRQGYINYRTSIRTIGKIAANLFVVSLEKADTYYNALLSRGYDGELRFLQEERKTKPVLWVLLVLYLGIMGLIYFIGNPTR